MTTHDVPLRSARDRLIDLLRIGDTYPITDLNVVADQLKVPFGGAAKIPVEHAQAGIQYELCDPEGQPLGGAFAATGSDATLVIESPRVTEDITYRIRATKIPGALPPQAARFLDEVAPVRVGLDTGLVIEITQYAMPGSGNPVQAPLLDPGKTNPQPADPRLVPFGAAVDVRVKSQEGVQYSLILNGQDTSTPTVTGDLSAIVLRTPALQEDTVIQVRATKHFPAAERRNPETTPLDMTLYVKVSANPALAVSVAGTSIVDHRQDAAIRIANTQKSAQYRVYARAIPDRDFIRGATAGRTVVTVPVAGQPNVQVLAPAPSDRWRVPTGYAPAGDAVAGTGADVTVPLKALEDDTMVVVAALKDHAIDVRNPASPTLPSALGLDQAAVVLVRPDPARPVTLRVPVVDAQTGNTMQVSNGQPGVFYYFRQAPSGKEFPRAAYFHKRDDQDERQNKGIEQLAVDVDFVVATDPDQQGVPGRLDLARTFPVPPVLAIKPLATGSSLRGRAMKAQTRVDVPMAQTASIPAIPVIRVAEPVVDYGAPATIVIAASRSDEQYQVTLRGAPVTLPVAGTDADLSVTTKPLTADTVFEVVVTRPRDSSMRVERVNEVRVAVRPGSTPPDA
jgi:hypothetical protein